MELMVAAVDVRGREVSVRQWRMTEGFGGAVDDDDGFGAPLPVKRKLKIELLGRC